MISSNYFYLMRVIFKQINLTYRWDTNRYYHFKSKWTGSNWDEGVLHTPQISNVEPHHQAQFSVLPRISLLGYSQHILSLTNRVSELSDTQQFL